MEVASGQGPGGGKVRAVSCCEGQVLRDDPVVLAGRRGGQFVSASLNRLWFVFCLDSSDTDVI